MTYQRQAIQWAKRAKVIINRVRMTMLYWEYLKSMSKRPFSFERTNCQRNAAFKLFLKWCFTNGKCIFDNNQDKGCFISLLDSFLIMKNNEENLIIRQCDVLCFPAHLSIFCNNLANLRSLVSFSKCIDVNDSESYKKKVNFKSEKAMFLDCFLLSDDEIKLEAYSTEG